MPLRCKSCAARRRVLVQFPGVMRRLSGGPRFRSGGDCCIQCGMSATEALMVGISGMRGTIGGTLTPPVVSRMAAAFAAWLKSTSKPADGTRYRVVFGRDSRPSGYWVRDAAAAALIASGIEVIDLDIVTTPGCAMM